MTSDKKWREWVIYGDCYQHPDGYPVEGIKILSFESGPNLALNEKVTITEKAALDEADAKIERLEKELQDEYDESFRIIRQQKKIIEKYRASLSIISKMYHQDTCDIYKGEGLRCTCHIFVADEALKEVEEMEKK